MLRELLDIAFLEDFVGGLARVSGQRIAVFDGRRRLLAASPATSRYGKLCQCLPPTLPPRLMELRLPADEPPARILACTVLGVTHVVAPVYVQRNVAGFVAAGELRELRAEVPPEVLSTHDDASELRVAFGELPLFKATSDSKPVRSVRWVSRVLSEWCRHQVRIRAASEELALMGDIAALVSGRHDLQTVLDRIVAETARVMKCRYCSLRLYNPATRELTIKAVHNLSARYVNQGVIRRADNAIDDEALNGRLVYVENVADDARFQLRGDARGEGIVSALTTGLMYHGQPVGVMRVYTARRRRFPQTQRELLGAVAAQAATAIVNAQLLEERLRNAETERELRVAGQIQSRMLATPIPTHPHIEAARIFSPSSHVAGDFCDFISLCGGQTAAVVADVVGKGMPAALLGASVRGALRAGAEACLTPDDLLNRLNQHVCRDTTSREFVTLLIVAIDREGRDATVCSAGHEPLLLLRDGALRVIDEAGLVLGVDPHEAYKVHRIAVKPGDFLVLYTDGAIDAANFDGELFGRSRLHASLRQHGALAPDEVLHNIVWDIRRFVGLAEQADDLTLVGLRIL